MPFASLDGKYFAYQDGGAEMNMEPGPHPSRGWITIPTETAEGIAFNISGHTLRFDDGRGGAISFEHLYIEDMSENGPGLTRIGLVDSRYMWQFRTVTKHYNVYNDDKQSWNSKTTKTGTSTAAWTFREIVEDLARVISDASSGRQFGYVPGINRDTAKLDAVDTSSNPLVTDLVLEAVPAPVALAGVLSLAGGTLSVSNHGHIVISMPDEDRFSSLIGKLGLVESITSPLPSSIALQKPKELRILYRIKREKLFKKSYWEPVMRHDGLGAHGQSLSTRTPGEYLPVDDVLKDWGMSEKIVQTEYPIIHESRDEGKSKIQLRRAMDIRAQFYKLWRYNPGTSSTETRAQILPFHDEMGATGDPLSGEKQRVEVWCKDTQTYENDNKGKGSCLREVDAPAHAVRIENEEQGVVLFTTNYPIARYRQTGDGFILQDYALSRPERLGIVVSFLKKYQSTNLDDDFYEADVYTDKWTGLPNNGQRLTVIDESAYYIEQDHTGSGTYTPLNNSEIDARADMYAEAYFRGFKATMGTAPAEMVVAGYSSKVWRLCGRLHFMQVSANAQGYTTIYRVGFNSPINPGSYDYFDGYGGLNPEGNRISSLGPGWASKASAIAASADRRYSGLRRKGESVDFRNTTQYPQELPDFVNPQRKGLLVAEDWPNTRKQSQLGVSSIKSAIDAIQKAFSKAANIFSGSSGGAGNSGSGEFDQRTKHARITKKSKGRAAYTFVQKFDQTPNWGSQNWEAVILTPDPKDAKQKDEPGKSSEPYSNDPNNQLNNKMVIIPRSDGGKAGSKSDLTKSQPANKPGEKPNTASGPDSTYIWTDSPEKGKTYKGPLREVLMVGKHRKRGEDPDGHQICEAAIDKGSAKHHGSDKLCGILADIGERVRPFPNGLEICVEQVFDARTRDWRYMGWVPILDTPMTPDPDPPPTPTPPPPTPTPTPTPTGGGKPPPGKGPGPVVTPGPGSGGLPPCPFPWGTIPMPPEGLPGENGGRPAGAGGPVITGGGTTPYPPGGLGSGTPGSGVPSHPGVTSGGDGPVPADQPIPMGCYECSPPMVSADGFGGSFFFYNSYAFAENYFSHVPQFAAQYMLNTLQYQPTMMLNTHNAHRWNPRFPGSTMHPDATYQQTRMSSRFPGTPPLDPWVADRYEITTVADSFDWDDTTLEGERVTQDEYLGMTLGEWMVNTQNLLNSVHARLEKLDSRIRAEYNVKDTATILNGNSSVAYTTDAIFSGQPRIQATSMEDPALVWNPGELAVHTYTDNGDGSWTVTVQSENAAAGNCDVALDIKGPVADTTDLD